MDELSLREDRARHTDPVSSDQSSRRHTVYLKLIQIHTYTMCVFVHVHVCERMCDPALSSKEQKAEALQLNIKNH